MAELTVTKDLRQQDGIQNGENLITVTTAAPSLKLAESEQSNEVSYDVGDFEYTNSDDGMYYILSGIGSVISRAITIPAEATVDGVKKYVTEIGSDAFKDTDIVSVTIPHTIKKIGGGAFENCTSLESVTIEEPVNNSGLELIGTGAFWKCTGIKSITIPDTVEEIGYGAFSYCTSLEQVVFGTTSKLKTIRTTAFSYCTALETFDIPESVTNIQINAFYNCSNLTKVYFHDPYTWFVSDQIALNDMATLVLPSDIDPSNDYTEYAAATMLRSSEYYVDENWYKIKQMLTPEITLDGHTLSITDPLGVAEEYYLYVGGHLKAAIYPDSSDSDETLPEDSGSAATYSVESDSATTNSVESVSDETYPEES